MCSRPRWRWHRSRRSSSACCPRFQLSRANQLSAMGTRALGDSGRREPRTRSILVVGATRDGDRAARRRGTARAQLRETDAHRSRVRDQQCSRVPAAASRHLFDREERPIQSATAVAAARRARRDRRRILPARRADHRGADDRQPGAAGQRPRGNAPRIDVARAIGERRLHHRARDANVPTAATSRDGDARDGAVRDRVEPIGGAQIFRPRGRRGRADARLVSRQDRRADAR